MELQSVEMSRNRIHEHADGRIWIRKRTTSFFYSRVVDPGQVRSASVYWTWISILGLLIRVRVLMIRVLMIRVRVRPF